MLSPKPMIEGDFNFVARPLEDEERKYYGIFISHASKDNETYLFPLLQAMRENNLHPLCDRDILSGGDDFQKKIESYLDCYAGVIVITENSLKSNWVNYEIGIFAGNNTQVFLYDPEDLLTNQFEIPGVANVYGSHIGRYLPAYKTVEELIAALRNVSPYADMCLEENSFITKRDFLDIVIDRVETTIARIESPVFDRYAEQLAKCRLNTLVTNFGMFYPEHGDGEHCYANRFKPLENGNCPVSNQPCALVSRQKVTEENKECVVLNYVLRNGKHIKAGERYANGETCEVGSLVFHLPLNKVYGTEFKFFIDVPDQLIGDELLEMFHSVGIHANMSDNIGSKRLYVSLPERRAQGLFRLDHEFNNNFLCPRAAKNRY